MGCMSSKNDKAKGKGKGKGKVIAGIVLCSIPLIFELIRLIVGGGIV
jgi:hypothetical protein